MKQVEMSDPNTPRTVEPLRSIPAVIRPWVTGRRGLIIFGLAVVIAGLALGWGWLAALGIAPLILSLLPCAVMCAIGACALMKASSLAAKPSSVEPPKSPGQE